MEPMSNFALTSAQSISIVSILVILFVIVLIVVGVLAFQGKINLGSVFSGSFMV